MTIGALDTNSAALERRVALQERSFDLNQWIFSHLPPTDGQRWLDLGCGRGKQTIPLLEAGCFVTAVDLSQESLDAIPDHPRLIKTRSSLDEITDLGRFDCAVGSYSLYYANDPARLFAALGEMVDALFFCGPAHDNNRELKAILGEDGPTAPSRFMEDVAPALARKHFNHVSVDRFENRIEFSSDEITEYWRNHNLYDPARNVDFPDPFVNTKRGIGVAAR